MNLFMTFLADVHAMARSARPRRASEVFWEDRAKDMAPAVPVVEWLQ